MDRASLRCLGNPPPWNNGTVRAAELRETRATFLSIFFFLSRFFEPFRATIHVTASRPFLLATTQTNVDRRPPTAANHSFDTQRRAGVHTLLIFSLSLTRRSSISTISSVLARDESEHTLTARRQPQRGFLPQRDLQRRRGPPYRTRLVSPPVVSGHALRRDYWYWATGRPLL